MHICTRVFVHIYTHMCMCVYVCIYIYIYICLYESHSTGRSVSFSLVLAVGAFRSFDT